MKTFAFISYAAATEAAASVEDSTRDLQVSLVTEVPSKMMVAEPVLTQDAFRQPVDKSRIKAIAEAPQLPDSYADSRKIDTLAATYVPDELRSSSHYVDYLKDAASRSYHYYFPMKVRTTEPETARSWNNLFSAPLAYMPHVGESFGEFSKYIPQDLMVYGRNQLKSYASKSLHDLANEISPQPVVVWIISFEKYADSKRIILNCWGFCFCINISVITAVISVFDV